MNLVLRRKPIERMLNKQTKWFSLNYSSKDEDDLSPCGHLCVCVFCLSEWKFFNFQIEIILPENMVLNAYDSSNFVAYNSLYQTL